MNTISVTEFIKSITKTCIQNQQKTYKLKLI